jgi:hypothetical protein
MMGLRGVTLVCLLASAGSAFAQSAPAFESKQFVVSAGLLTSRGYPIGDRTADLRRNATNATPFTLFRAESDIEGAPGFDARLAYALSRAFSVEVAGTFSRPQLRVRITEDAESTPSIDAGEEIGQFTVDVSGLWHLPGRTLGSRARPYVIGGGGYLRQLHEDRYLVETGSVAYGGGGVHYWFRGGSTGQRAMGVRGEASIVMRSRGIDFEDKRRTYPRLSALGFIAF